MLLTFLICLRLSDIVYFGKRKDSSSICHHRRHRHHRRQVPAACDRFSHGWTRYRALLLLFIPPPPLPFPPPPPPPPPELDDGANCGSEEAHYHWLVHHSSRVYYDVAAFY